MPDIIEYDWMNPVDQYQEAMDYEANAQYDRYDGWGDPDPNDGWYNEPDGRTDEQRAADEKIVAEFHAQVLAEAEARHAMDALFGPVNVPF